jgi:hypothetical protein
VATAPEDLVAAATDSGFEIVGWDEHDAGLRGNGHEYIGTHAEIRAYLRAWEMCRSIETYATAEELAKGEAGTLSKTLITLRYDGEILPGQTAQITARPQTGSFRGERIAIPDTLAPYFDVNDVRVGNRSQFPTAQSIGGETFAMRIDLQAKLLATDYGRGIRVAITEPAFAEWGREWSMDTCQTSMDLWVVVTCKQSVPEVGLPFEMLILGKTMRPS